MKKNLLLLCLVAKGLLMQAQIPNASFENVTATKPDDWNTAANNYNSYFIRDTSDAQTGIHAAYIKGFSAQSYTVQGAVLGTFTMNARPVSLTGWYKCNIVQGDSLVFYANVYQTSAFGGIAANCYTYATTSMATYKQFTATINYNNFPTTNALSSYIGIYFSGMSVDGAGFTIPQTGTWAIIDNLAFVNPTPPNPVSVAENPMNINIEQVYPQPCAGIASLIYSLKHEAICNLSIFDITGKEVKKVITGEKQSPGRYKAEMNMVDLEPGVYFAKLQVGNEVKVTRILRP